jgi:hypothetical protein
MKMEQTQCSETSAIKHHTPENNPKGYTQHTEHSESLKSRIIAPIYITACIGIMALSVMPCGWKFICIE